MGWNKVECKLDNTLMGTIILLIVTLIKTLITQLGIAHMVINSHQL